MTAFGSAPAESISVTWYALRTPPAVGTATSRTLRVSSAETAIPASRPAAFTASFSESVAGAGAAPSRESVEVTETTSPPVTPTATRPSYPAGRSPKRWRRSTVAPAPTGLTATFSSAPTAAASSPNRSRCRVR